MENVLQARVSVAMLLTQISLKSVRFTSQEKRPGEKNPHSSGVKIRTYTEEQCKRVTQIVPETVKQLGQSWSETTN